MPHWSPRSRLIELLQVATYTQTWLSQLELLAFWYRRGGLKRLMQIGGVTAGGGRSAGFSVVGKRAWGDRAGPGRGLSRAQIAVVC